jgi:hypothetical protein
MPTPIIKSYCDRSGNMVRPWAAAGYECHCYDLEPTYPSVEYIGTGVIHHHAVNVLSLHPTNDAAISFAFPPCTNLAVSGARWFRDKGLRGLIEALEVVEVCRELCSASGAPWMLENPVSVLSSYWRKPDYIFHPWEYAGYPGGQSDTYTKKTCLWTGGGFVMPEKKPLAPTDNRIHRMPPSDDRGYLRSITPTGFAEAVFQANSGVLVPR